MRDIALISSAKFNVITSANPAQCFPSVSNKTKQKFTTFTNKAWVMYRDSDQDFYYMYRFKQISVELILISRFTTLEPVAGSALRQNG